MSGGGLTFNPPPGWPTPPDGWVPPIGWQPDTNWPPIPEGWQLWLPLSLDSSEAIQAGEVDANEPPDANAFDANNVDRDVEVSLLRAEVAALRRQIAVGAGSDAEPKDHPTVLEDVGVYRYHHPLESAAAYRERLEFIDFRLKELVQRGSAITKSEVFTFNNSLARGRKLASDLSKLMLRAYNAEVDAAIRGLRPGKADSAKRRIIASRTSIARLGALMEMQIGEDFHQLRIQEIELVSDWLAKKQEERDAAREYRARLREERRVQKEFEEERAQLNKERTHIINTINTLNVQGRVDEDLLLRLTSIDEAIQHNDFRAANIRAGYVYVISNEGAFGAGVVKIGLTRRLEPEERIVELSGAAVPFRFDTHALFFSEDAVTLETELHKHFADRALNKANPRKEFFFATPAEVREVLLEHVGNILEFVEEAEALEFRQSISTWPANLASNL